MKKYVLLTGAFSLAFTSLTTTTHAQTTVSTAPPEPRWDSSAAAGLTLTRGNSDTLLATVNLQTQKKTTIHEFIFGADAAYGESNGTVDNNTLHGFGQYNYLFTDRTYGGVR